MKHETASSSSAGTLTIGGTGAVGNSTGNGSGTLSRGTWVLDMADASSGGTAGSDWDALSFSGTLNFTGSDTNFITLDLRNIGSANAAWGEGPGYTAEDANGYKIIEASGGIIGFDADDFNIITDNWTDGGGWWYNWKIYQSGNALYLSYNAVPEPGTYAMISLLLILLTWKFIKKRKFQSNSALKDD